MRQVLRQVRDTTLAAYAHQDLPFEDLVQALERERALKRSSLCQVLFVLQHAVPPPRQLPGLTLRVMEAHQGMTEPGITATTFDCILMMRETPQGLTASCIYKTALFEAATIKRLLRDFQEVLARLVAQPEQQLSTLGAPGSESARIPLDRTASISYSDKVSLHVHVIGDVWRISSWRNMTMALFFQLLTEEELRTLTVEQLERLRAAFYHELSTNEAIKRALSTRVAQTLTTIHGEQGQGQQTDDDESGC